MLRYVRQFHREIRPRIFHPVAYFAILCPIFLAEKVYTNDITNCLVSCVCMSARGSPLQRNNRNKKRTLHAKRLVIRINGINKRDDSKNLSFRFFFFNQFNLFYLEILSTLKRKFSPSPSSNFEKGCGLSSVWASVVSKPREIGSVSLPSPFLCPYKGALRSKSGSTKRRRNDVG